MGQCLFLLTCLLHLTFEMFGCNHLSILAFLLFVDLIQCLPFGFFHLHLLLKLQLGQEFLILELALELVCIFHLLRWASCSANLVFLLNLLGLFLLLSFAHLLAKLLEELHFLEKELCELFCIHTDN